MNKAAGGVDPLDLECIAFSYYLTRQKPGQYVLDKYREAHATSGLILNRKTNRMDRFLLNVSTRHPLATKLVDSYTSIFFKTSTARRKWILLLAILESCAPSYQHFDSPDSRSKSLILIGILWRIVGFLVALSVSIILFMPLHLIFNTKSKLLGRYYVADINEV
jgi:hypothetical protein